MRAVADAVGLSAAGLYRYVRSRDDLITLMVDAALKDMTLPIPDGDWEHQLLVVAHELLGIYVAHPWLAEAAFGSGPAGPNALRYFDHCLAIMAALPASPATKMEALGMLTGVVSLFARAAASPPPDPRTLFAALDPQAHPHLTAALDLPPPAGAPARPLPANTHQPAQRPTHDVGPALPSDRLQGPARRG